MKTDIFISLTEASTICNWLGRQILIEKNKSDHRNFEFEVQIPEPFIGHQLAFAHVDVMGDSFGLTFERYPPDVVVEVKMRREIAELAETCAEGCEESFELFASRFTKSIDERYANSIPEIRDVAIKIAREHGYPAPNEIESTLCPCGCGSHEHL